jgi:hypothetical protein
MAKEVGVMKQRQILWAIVFGSMLAITGCGDDESGNGGSAGSAGSNGGAGSGGSAGSAGSSGSASSSCEAICGATCLFGGIAPGGDFGACVSTCEAEAPDLDDNCGAEMEAYLDCLVANDCSLVAFDCLGQAEAWAMCSGV